MSDLFEVRQKVEEGAEWRGEINVSIDEETKTLTARQLRDPEFWEVMSLVDTEEIEQLQDSLPDEQMETVRELREKDELDEDEEARLEAVEAELEEADVDLFSVLSPDTFEGIRRAAKYGIEPDGNDIQRVLTQHGGDIKEQYGVADEDAARKWANENIIAPMIDDCTNFTSFTIGIKVLTETIGDTGNLNS